MSSDRLSEMFDACATRMAAGATVEQCLRDYPGDADRLRPLLDTVTLMRRALPPAHETRAAQDRGRAAMMAALQTLPASPRRRAASTWLRTLASVAVLIVVLLGAVTFAAEGAIPGDALYTVKLISESARMSVTRDPALAALFAQRRINEVRTVLTDGRQVAVNFVGQVESISGSRWQVSGLPVEVGSSTEMTETIAQGDEVIVEGFAAVGVVRADEIERLAPKQPAPTPVFTPTEPVVPTSTPTTMPSQTPLPTVQPSWTPSSLPPTLTSVAPTVTAEGDCTAAPSDGWVAYALRAGDTLSELAASTSISLDQLLAVNCLTMADARSLVVGETLYLPSAPPTPRPRATAADPASAAQPAVNAANDDHSGDSSAEVDGDNDDDHSGSDNSGPGSSDDDGNDDHSGSNSGSDDSSGGDNSDDDSGSNSGSDNSGHGSDDDNSGHGSDDD